MRMKNIRSLILAIFVLVTFPSWGGNEANIAIEDYIAGSVYEIIQVDGRAPERAKHGMFVTVVPIVLVSEGTHRLTVKYNNIKLDQKAEKTDDIVVEVKKGNRYRLEQKDGKPLLNIVNEK